MARTKSVFVILEDRKENGFHFVSGGFKNSAEAEAHIERGIKNDTLSSDVPYLVVAVKKIFKAEKVVVVSAVPVAEHLGIGDTGETDDDDEEEDEQSSDPPVPAPPREPVTTVDEDENGSDPISTTPVIPTDIGTESSKIKEDNDPDPTLASEEKTENSTNESQSTSETSGEAEQPEDDDDLLSLTPATMDPPENW